MEHEQIVIAADDHIRVPRERGFQHFVIFGVAAGGHRPVGDNEFAVPCEELAHGLQDIGAEVVFVVEARPARSGNQQGNRI